MISEENIINQLKKLANNPESLNLDDDIAEITPPKDQQLIISKDLASSNIHFFAKDNGYKIAYQIMMPNISDLASAGAKPLYYLIGFGKNNQIDEIFLKDFCQALKEIQNKYNIKLIGGDTINCQNDLTFSITIIGSGKKQQILKRSNAKEKQLIFVTGNIGDSFLGLKSLENNLNNIEDQWQHQWQKAFYYPNPPIDFMHQIAKKNLSKCAIDISDGLIKELDLICQKSNLSCNLDLQKIPLSDNSKKFLNNNKQYSISDLACAGGDYQIIFTCDIKNSQEIINIAKKQQIKLTQIAILNSKLNTQQNNLTITNNNQEIKLKNLIKGYNH